MPAETCLRCGDFLPAGWPVPLCARCPREAEPVVGGLTRSALFVPTARPLTAVCVVIAVMVVGDLSSAITWASPLGVALGGLLASTVAWLGVTWVMITVVAAGYLSDASMKGRKRTLVARLGFEPQVGDTFPLVVVVTPGRRTVEAALLIDGPRGVVVVGGGRRTTLTPEDAPKLKVERQRITFPPRTAIALPDGSFVAFVEEGGSKANAARARACVDRLKSLAS